MRYIGTKSLALSNLGDFVQRHAPGISSVCDPFAGTCSVSRYFKAAGLRVETGDLLEFSYIFQQTLVGLNSHPSFSTLASMGEICPDGVAHVAALDRLSELPGVQNFVYRNFSAERRTGRNFFTVENAARIDAMRIKIAEWADAKAIDCCEHAYLKTALINAADRVANTAGTYYAFLKNLDRKAIKPIALSPPAIIDNGKRNDCFRVDARELASNTAADMLYLDPPYNTRDYSRYYHFPETLALGDRPEPKGASGVPAERIGPRSDFTRKETASRAFQEIVKNAKSRYILMHYATNGLITHTQIMDVMSSVGKASFEDIKVRAYAARKTSSEAEVCHRLYWCDRGRLG